MPRKYEVPVERCEASRGERRCQRAEGHSGPHYHRCNQSTYEWDEARAFVTEPDRGSRAPIRPCTCSPDEDRGQSRPRQKRRARWGRIEREDSR